MTDFPEPLTPPDCVLRDFAFMPVEVERLRRSKAWLYAKREPEIGFYMFNLWAASWHETPAASLEDDDDVLADAAMCDLKRWIKVRDKVLRGWVKCSDGRLYHPVVAEKALEAWQAKVKQRGRTKAATLARMASHEQRDDDRNDKRDVQRNVDRDVGHDEERDEPRNEQRDDDVTSTKGQGREGTGKGQGSSVPNGTAHEPDSGTEGKPDWWPKRDRYGRVTSEITDKLLFDLGKAVLGASAGGQVSKLKKCYRSDLRACADILLQADEKSNSRQWFAGVLKRAEQDEPVVPQHEKFPDEIYRDDGRARAPPVLGVV